MPECDDDKREELLAVFKTRFQEWLNPVCHPHVRWRDVEEARHEVICCIERLVRDKKMTAEEAVKL